MKQNVIQSLPDEIIKNILDYSIEKVNYYLKNEIKMITKNILCIFLGTKFAVKNKLDKLRRIHSLIEKYNSYQNDYEYHVAYKLRKNIHIEEYPPLLLDACMAGCRLPIAHSSIRDFNDNVFDDIKEIIELVPESIKCKFGQLRCRTYLTPLHSAIYNEAIPIEVIKYLIDKKANVNEPLRVNNSPINILDDLHENVSLKREKMIIDIFSCI